jgi:hypothetical protein
MAQIHAPFPLFELPDGLLDRVVGFLELWDLAAARSASRALRASAGRRARLLRLSPATMLRERGDGYAQVGKGPRVMGGRRLRGGERRRCGDADTRPSPPSRQKRRPTSFQLFPNARELELMTLGYVYGEDGKPFEMNLDLPRVFRLPAAPADAAAARAALAGLTRLALWGGMLDPGQLAAALLLLPGLRGLQLMCEEWEIGRRGADALGSDLLAALAGCPRLESLDWDLKGWPFQGAPGCAVLGCTRWCCGLRGSVRNAHPRLSKVLPGVTGGILRIATQGDGVALQPSPQPCTQQPAPRRPRSPKPQGVGDVAVPLPTRSLPAALPALTHLQLSCAQEVDVARLTGLRRLDVSALLLAVMQGRTAVVGLSGLTFLEDLSLESDFEPLAGPSDLAPLTALTRLVMACLPPELASLPVAARLRRLELQAFGVPEPAPGGGDGGGGGAGGTAAAALAALARGAPVLEWLRIRVDESCGWPNDPSALLDHPGGAALGVPLGAGAAWPSLTHLEVTPWAALLLAGCGFPRLSRLVAVIKEGRRGKNGIVFNMQLRTAIATLASKARDHAALLVHDLGRKHSTGVLATAAAVPGLRHLSWARRLAKSSGGAAAPPGDWARLAASLESLELAGPLAALGFVEPLAALTRLTQLFLSASSGDEKCAARQAGGEPPMSAAGSAPARTARALARLPRLVHLRVSFPVGKSPGTDWGCPLVAAEVAAELSRCPKLRVLEVDYPTSPLWQHESAASAYGPRPRVPRPSATWPPFIQALRAGGFSGTVRPSSGGLDSGFGIEI